MIAALPDPPRHRVADPSPVVAGERRDEPSVVARSPMAG